MLKILKDKNLTPNKILCIFIILHVLLWSILPLVREILPVDAMECIIWGGYADLGTTKHPPLAGWIAYIVYNLFGKTDYSIYLLGQVCVAVGFVYIYKLGKIFIGDVKASLSVMLLEACFVYTYMGIYEGYNPNFLLLAFFPFLTYYFYKCLNENSLKNWVFLGLGFGLSFIAKYQTIMLFLPMLIYLIATKQGRKQFKNKGLYIAAIIAFLCVIPHLVWLFNHDFFPFNYFVLSEMKYSNYYSWQKHILAPVCFLANQFLTIIAVLFIYFTANKFSGKPIRLNNHTGNEDSIYLIIVGLLPIAFQSVHGALNGAYLIPQWGYVLLFMIPILLFYFFPFELTQRTIKYFASWIIIAMITSFVVLGVIYCTEKSFASRFPVEQVTNNLSKIYLNETGKPLKYIGGFIELSIPLALYNDDYTVVLSTYEHKNPWIDEADLKKSGVLVIGRYNSQMKKYVSTTAPYFDEKFKMKKFEITVKNVLGKEKKYKMFYVVVPPIK